jgi:hypothetical protein
VFSCTPSNRAVTRTFSSSLVVIVLSTVAPDVVFVEYVDFIHSLVIGKHELEMKARTGDRQRDAVRVGWTSNGTRK